MPFCLASADRPFRAFEKPTAPTEWSLAREWARLIERGRTVLEPAMPRLAPAEADPDPSSSGATVSPVEVRHRSGRASRGGRWHLDRHRPLELARDYGRDRSRTRPHRRGEPRPTSCRRSRSRPRFSPCCPSRRSQAPAAGAKFSPHACRVVPSQSEPPGQGARSPGNATDSPTRSTIAASRSSLASRPSLALGESG